MTAWEKKQKRLKKHWYDSSYTKVYPGITTVGGPICHNMRTYMLAATIGEITCKKCKRLAKSI